MDFVIPSSLTAGTDLPLLSWMLAAPLVGLVMILLLPQSWLRLASAVAMLATLAIASVAVLLFDAAVPGFHYLQTLSWLPDLGIAARLGVDSLSVYLLPLATLLFLGALVNAWNMALPSARLFHALLLLLLTLTLAILCALDTLFFFALWEGALLPLYFLVTLWSSDRNARHVAGQYVLLMLGSGALLLLGLLLAGTSGRGFDLTHGSALPVELQLPVFLLIFAGLAAKLPVVPLHTWLPNLALSSPPGIVALFAGIKLAAYALLRLSSALTPDALVQLHWLIAGLGTLGILYGAAAAIAQTNLRSVLAYCGVSHVGLFLLGIASGEPLGLQGAVLLLISLPITTGGLYLLTAFLHRRTGSTEIAALGGISASAPRFAALYLALSFAAIGVPGLVAFPAELMIFVSALKTHTGAALAALFGAGIAAAALLNAFRRAFYGRPKDAANAVADLLPREAALAVVLLLLALALGVFPVLVLGH